MYKELTDAKSCPRDLASEFAELFQEDEKKIQYERLVKITLEDKFSFTGIDKRKVLDYINANKSKFRHVILSIEEFAQQRKDNNKEIKDLLPLERSKLQNDYYTFYFNHPIEDARREEFKIEDVIYSGMGGVIEGMISKIQRRQTKSGNAYYIITVEDELDSVQITLWGNQIGKYRDLIHEYSFIKVDIIPSPYPSWNMSKNGSIKKIRTFQEISEQEEIDMESAQGHADLLEFLQEHSKNENIE